MEFVSVHGGHSGQFCRHAVDSLEDIVRTYIRRGYTWVGITEHAPGLSQELLYPDEQKMGLTPQLMWENFSLYMRECRRLQKKYASEIQLYAAVEIEVYSGYEIFLQRLLQAFCPDYIVGSLHFVNDLCIDYSKERYDKAARAAGGLDALYCEYFDMQFAMLQKFRPAVVGHFDLIRIFDPEYRWRLQKAEIFSRITRNLALIREYGLILDYNTRALKKGAAEPYVSEDILDLCREMNIAVVPGDDSHGCADIHQYTENAIEILRRKGFDLNWPRPQLYQWQAAESAADRC
ncbi:MAG: histidinol phosphatase [Deltaproteobacteria bacterium]|nr:MAG: histidinol phosphatase [Deltaproteobacteria bacterium]